MSVSVDVGVMWRLSEDFNRRFGFRMQPAGAAPPAPPSVAPHAHHTYTAAHHYHHGHGLHHSHGLHHGHGAATAPHNSQLLFNGKS
ncbi:protein doublesex-like [Drosophila willistoni]|uniref:protein doublesex-like n=1 Tax=Drosophila willistoni TaxID=7260 RepID=UPI001F07DF73|nr:protein doublesex-like [Drosophila willistoni]